MLDEMKHCIRKHQMRFYSTYEWNKVLCKGNKISLILEFEEFILNSICIRMYIVHFVIVLACAC